MKTFQACQFSYNISKFIQLWSQNYYKGKEGLRYKSCILVGMREGESLPQRSSYKTISDLYVWSGVRDSPFLWSSKELKMLKKQPPRVWVWWTSLKLGSKTHVFSLGSWFIWCGCERVSEKYKLNYILLNLQLLQLLFLQMNS